MNKFLCRLLRHGPTHVERITDMQDDEWLISARCQQCGDEVDAVTVIGKTRFINVRGNFRMHPPELT